MACLMILFLRGPLASSYQNDWRHTLTKMELKEKEGRLTNGGGNVG